MRMLHMVEPPSIYSVHPHKGNRRCADQVVAHTLASYCNRLGRIWKSATRGVLSY